MDGPRNVHVRPRRGSADDGPAAARPARVRRPVPGPSTTVTTMLRRGSAAPDVPLTMRAVVFHKPNEFGIDTVDVPRLVPGQVVRSEERRVGKVRTARCRA